MHQHSLPSAEPEGMGQVARGQHSPTALTVDMNSSRHPLPRAISLPVMAMLCSKASLAMERVSRKPSSTAGDMGLHFRVQSSVLKPLPLQWSTQTHLVTAISGEKSQSKEFVMLLFHSVASWLHRKA